MLILIEWIMFFLGGSILNDAIEGDYLCKDQQKELEEIRICRKLSQKTQGDFETDSNASTEARIYKGKQKNVSKYF